MKLLKLVLKPKLFERVRRRTMFSVKLYLVRSIIHKLQMSVHTDVESAYKVFPKELLPIEYGGENGSLEKLHSKL